MGKYYEDFVIGEEVLSAGRTITETDIVMFAGLTGDYNSLHTDAEFAKETPFKERIAHGLLGLAITSGLMTRTGLFDGTVIAFLGVDWAFKGPIFIGDTIHFSMTIKDKRETSKPDRGIIMRDVALLNQRNEVVQQGTMTLMMKRRQVEEQ